MASSDEEALANAQRLPTQEALDKIERAFTYHAPTEGQRVRFVHLRGAARELAEVLVLDCEPGRELSLAMTKLEECVMWANAAIARE